MKVTKNQNYFVIFVTLVAFVAQREPWAVPGAVGAYGS
jgi:hypothetical protein